MSSFDPSKSGNCAQSTPQREDGENRSGSTWNSLPRTSLSKPYKSSSSSSTTLDESLLEGASESLDLDSIKYDSYKTPVNYEEHQAAGKLASHLAPRGRKLTTKTIHFSMRNAQQDWSNVNPILTLVDTLEWACSRLQNCMKMNDPTAHMQRLQSPNLCQAHHITFRKLASLCSVEDQHCADPAEEPYVKGKNNQPTSAENTRKKLVFQVSTSDASSNARRPCLRLLRQTHCASTQGPLLSGRQMEQILGDGTTTLSDGTNRLIPLGTPVIMALETLSKRFSTLPREMGPNNAEEIFLNELVKLIRCGQQELGRKKQHSSSPDAHSPCWLSCTCDGTLTIRYPSGHPAIIWTPTPLTYAPVVSGFPGEQNLDPAPRSPATTGQKTVTTEKRRNSGSTVHTSSRSSTSTGKRIERNRPVWQQAIALPSKTEFYLFLFDIPASMDSTTKDPSHFTPADGESISRLPRNAATLPNDKVQHLLLQMSKPTSKRVGQLVSENRQFAMQSGPTGPASFSNETGKPGCLEVHGHNQSHRLTDMTKGSAPTPQIGQLLAYVTPTGHGAVFRNLRLNQQSGCQPDIRLLPHSNLQAVFSSNFIQFHHEPNERHLPSVALSGRDFKSDPTTRFPSSLDLHLNEYLKIYHSGPGHLMIVFRLGDQVELSIVCDQCISEPETVGDHQSPSERTVTTEASPKSRLLSKLPFLNTLVKSSSSHSVLRNHKKREDAFRRTFKSASHSGEHTQWTGEMEDHRLLGRQLRQTKREIIRIADDWLRFLRTQLLLTRFVSRPMSPARMLQISCVTSSELAVKKREPTDSSRTKSLRSSEARTAVTGPLCVRFVGKTTRGVRSTPRCNGSERSHSGEAERNTNLLTHVVDEGAPTTPVETSEERESKKDLDSFLWGNYKVYRKNAAFAHPTAATHEPTTLGHVDRRRPLPAHPEAEECLTNRSLINLPLSNPSIFEFRPLAAECPVLLRSWLSNLFLAHPDLEKMLRNPASSAVPVISRNIQNSDLLHRIEFHSPRAILQGCRCNRHEIPEVTDLELDWFLNNAVPPTQAVVMVVFDSRDITSRETANFQFFRRLYTEQHRSSSFPRMIKSDLFPKRNYSETSSNLQSKPASRSIQHGSLGTGACVSMNTKLARYRFVCYDLAQHATGIDHIQQQESLLRKRHGHRPKVGDCLVFLGGRLCFLRSNLNGCPDAVPSKRQLEDKVTQCTNALLRDGFAFPMDYQFQ